MTDILVREINSNFLLYNPILCARLNKLTLQKPEGYSSEMRNYLRRKIESNYHDNGRIFLAYELPAKIITGWSLLVPSYIETGADIDEYWFMIYVDLDSRRSGLGSVLLDKAINYSNKHSIRMFVTPWHTASTKFYEANGFYKARTKTPFTYDIWRKQPKQNQLVA